MKSGHRDLAARLDKLQRSVDKLAKAKAAGVDAIVALDYPSAEIQLRVTGRHERKRALACRKEPWTVEWIESAPADAVLWDVGANVGAYSLIAAKRPGGGLRVVSVEPSFSTYAALCGNVLLNDAGDRVTPLCAMLGDRSGTGVLGYSDVDPGASFHAGGAASLKEGFVSRFDQTVLVFTIDDLVQRHGLPAPDFLKIDVDGAETQVVHGAREALRSARSVLIEISDREARGVTPLMEAAGLVPVDEHRRRPRSDDDAPGASGYVRYDRPV